RSAVVAAARSARPGRATAAARSPRGPRTSARGRAAAPRACRTAAGRGARAAVAVAVDRGDGATRRADDEGQSDGGRNDRASLHGTFLREVWDATAGGRTRDAVVLFIADEGELLGHARPNMAAAAHGRGRRVHG